MSDQMIRSGQKIVSDGADCRQMTLAVDVGQWYALRV